jgi:hypothetical protein
MDLFNRQWSTYRQIVDHDLMEHRALSAELGNALTSYLQQRQAKAGAGGAMGTRISPWWTSVAAISPCWPPCCVNCR